MCYSHLKPSRIGNKNACSPDREQADTGDGTRQRAMLTGSFVMGIWVRVGVSCCVHQGRCFGGPLM